MGTGLTRCFGWDLICLAVDAETGLEITPKPRMGTLIVFIEMFLLAPSRSKHGSRHDKHSVHF
jgi:hypothetical protein